MGARANVEAVAERVAELTGLSCAPEPSPPGRGDVFAFVEPPTFVYESSSSTLCPLGRAPRLRSAVVVVGAGTAPGQLLALVDAAETVAAALDLLEGWSSAGDGVPATFGETPAYSFPIRT
jgi:hypothetical protein